MEGWQQIFSFVITPILFGGLFSMSFITMIIALRGEKRAIAKNQLDIVKNAKSNVLLSISSIFASNNESKIIYTSIKQT